MTTRRRLTGLLATAGLVAIVAGIPAVLIAIGATPIPDRVPSWDTVAGALTSRDDGTLAVRALAVLAWAAWLFLTGAILLEVTARLRGLTPPALPGLALPQAAARGLVGAAVLLFVAGPTITAAPTAAAAPQSSATATHAHDVTAAAPLPVAHQESPRADPATREHTVTRGESLWSIAQDHLGDGRRYTEIAALNTSALGGRPAFLLPGTVLTLPTTDPAKQPVGEEGTYTVRKGDTLSGIAHDKLGDARRYPEIFDASAHITQPGGEHLSDPDVIDIGWTLTIPKQHSSAAPEPTAAATQPPGTETHPLPSPSRAPATGPTAQPDLGAARARRTPRWFGRSPVCRIRGHSEVRPADHPSRRDE